MFKIEQEKGIRLVCNNCGHRVFEPNLMKSVENVPCCEVCADDFIIDSHIDFGTMLIKKSSLDEISKENVNSSQDLLDRR